MSSSSSSSSLSSSSSSSSSSYSSSTSSASSSSSKSSSSSSGDTYFKIFRIDLLEPYEGDIAVPTGVSLKAQIIDPTGANIGSPITTGFVEIGNGFYLWTHEFANFFHGGVVFERVSDSKVMDFQPINPEENAFLDPLMSEVPGGYLPGTAGRALGSLNRIRVTGPEVFGGPITIFSGDDYLVIDGRQFTFDDLGDEWPDLTGAVVVFNTRPVNTALTAVADQPMTVTVASGPGKQTQLELTSAQSVLYSEGEWRYRVVATLSNGNKATLARGVLTVD